FFRNPLFCVTAAVSAALNSDQDGSVLHPVLGASIGPCALGTAEFVHANIAKRLIADRYLFIGLPCQRPTASSGVVAGVDVAWNKNASRSCADGSLSRCDDVADSA